ncbi:hypothetical protein [Pontibacter akesuensis]|nr:hypothetical protein [Pontibacter akesuensis]
MVKLRILFYLLSASMVLSLSCAESDPEPVATFKFTVNGTLLEWNGPGNGIPVCVLCGPGLSNYASYFVLHSSAPQMYGEALILQLNAASLETKTYSDTVSTAVDSLEATHRLYLPTLKAAATEVGDYASVTFTSIENDKYYSGTLRASLTSSPFGPDAPKVEIEGEFKNVRGSL